MNGPGIGFDGITQILGMDGELFLMPVGITIWWMRGNSAVIFLGFRCRTSSKVHIAGHCRRMGPGFGLAGEVVRYGNACAQEEDH